MHALVEPDSERNYHSCLPSAQGRLGVNVKAPHMMNENQTLSLEAGTSVRFAYLALSVDIIQHNQKTSQQSRESPHVSGRFVGTSWRIPLPTK